MKRLARSIPGANSRTIALRALAIPSVKLALVHNVGRLVRREIKTLCADKFASIQRDTSSLIHGMSLEPIFSELSKNAPILTALLMESCPSTKSDAQKRIAITISSAILLKFRNPKMKLVASMFSMVLQAGHAGRQVSMHGVCMHVRMCMCHIIFICNNTGLQKIAKEHAYTFLSCYIKSP